MVPGLWIGLWILWVSRPAERGRGPGATFWSARGATGRRWIRPAQPRQHGDRLSAAPLTAGTVGTDGAIGGLRAAHW